MQIHLFTSVLILCLWQFAAPVRAEKVLIYDEERGIISVEKDDLEKFQRTKPISPSSQKQLTTPPPASRKKRSPNDLHVGREKDPPDLYFRSGLQYFKNNDFKNALKNFQYVVKVDTKPEYLLWLGKTYRKVEQDSMMLSVMNRIVDRYPDSDVADDALFEIAFYSQRNLDYNAAADAYARLAEQYPFGLSYSNGHEFLEMSRNQRKNMRAEMVTTLTFLGYDTHTLSDAYTQFQQNNGLEVSGKADASTVKAIKEVYAARVEAEALVGKTRKKVMTTVKWGSIAGFILLFNLGVLLVARLRIRRTGKQLESLQALLLELDTATL
ncbi:MAG: tetratricopeptide repeat protein [Chitinivibrionales bacterium]